MRHENETADTASWWLIVAMAGACLIACRGLGFRIDAARAIVPAAAIGLLWAGAVLGRARGRPRLAAGATAFLLMTSFTIIGVVLSYALAARAGPLWDGRLAAADVRLGFEWPAVFDALDGHPVALWVGGVAYHSLTVQMIVCIVVLSAVGRFDALRIAVAAAIVGGFATILISGAMPAMGNVFDPAGYRRLWPSVAWMERAMIAGLRDGSWRTLDLTQLMGIVTFPSFHATLPIILARAQRDVPVWRIVAPVWAGVTIVATPVFGGHYGVDVLAGIAIAPPAIVAGAYIVRVRAAAQRPIFGDAVTPITGPAAGLRLAGRGRRRTATGSGVGDDVV